MKRLLLLSILVPLILAASCAPALPVVKGYSSRWKFYDIEIPGGQVWGYDYLERESFSFKSPFWPGFRVGEAVFVGETRRDVVAYDYRNSLVRRGYKLLKELTDESLDKTEMVFYHHIRDEILKITIRRKGPKSKIFVTIDVGPNLDYPNS